MSFSLALLLSLVIQTQDAGERAKQTGSSDIIVEAAKPIDPDAISKRVRDGYPPRMLRDPIMRYHVPVCVQVNGLGESGNAVVLKYMVETMQSLSIRMSREGCRANAVVVVSTEPVAQLKRIHAQTPLVLSAETLTEKLAELASGAHAVVWHNRTVRGSDGEVLPMSGAVAGWTGTGDLGTNLVNNNGTASRRVAGYSVAADIGVVAYDATQLDDVELKQLANNAVMQLLAPGFNIDVEPGSPETILSGIKDGAGPIELTRFDRAMLTALYSMRPNQYGTALGRAAGKAYLKE